MKTVENFLKPDVCGVELERKDVTNIKFYVAMLVGIEVANSHDEIINKLGALPKVAIQKEVLINALNITFEKFRMLGGTDQIAKGPSLLNSLLKNDG